MDKDNLKQILDKHKMWLDNKGGGRANLRSADLRDADLSDANLSYAALGCADLSGADLRDADLSDTNLSGADLRGADLRGANLSGADLDFSCWPLWCGSKDVKVDRRIAAQLAAHFCALDCDDDDYRKARSAILKFAKTSHIAHHMISGADKSRDDKFQGEAKKIKNV